MRLSAVQVGVFDDGVLDVGFRGVDEAGVRRSLSVQRSVCGPDAQDVAGGVDLYCVCTELGLTTYGCLQRVRIEGAVLTLELEPTDAEILLIPDRVELELGGSGVDVEIMLARLRDIVEWGAIAKRPLVVQG